MSPGDTPLVSIVVPVHNAEHAIQLLLESLKHIDYPPSRLEVFVVDNGSDDHTRDVVATFPVILLQERTIRSSYAARNRGVAQAGGEIIAFTDADCLVTPSWIREGIRPIQEGSADLVGGRVEFFLSSPRAAAEIFDASSHMHSEDLVAAGKGAATANLFVRRDVLRKVGEFPRTVQSGGDMIWTRAALTGGFRLAYAPGAVVRHPARGLRELLRKALRVGIGSPNIARRSGSPQAQLLRTAVRSALPGGPRSLRRRITHHGFAVGMCTFLRVWFVSYLYGLTWALGVFIAYARDIAYPQPDTRGKKEQGQHGS